ncbi:bifunctional metallophosphatase/5'-nucleotidase [Rossellomorea vietnamensis]|uniref:Bifunctional metallophosphatase/5'-nucleotidase n=1 Tax=Rossellomorea vietnamensis TaxID=218284 RepID=A0A5D4K8T9_9BACI|nr:bifunctional UDP-sugar hydrolase/5'-nucleotidase [Rossellomorea vietnamensis]TYR73787.1 bifunctional metallophosphatase/5'-nucleotidase [Rossellomorea vietnamensis]
MKETIHIYHTNDLHSHFENWPRIRDFLKLRKQWHLDAGDEVFLFDIGDHVDRWHPLSEATLGKGNVEMLNDVGYDAVTIGNNEGITFSYSELNDLYSDARFEVLLANLHTKDGKIPAWAKPYSIYETKAGTRVGVLGLTAHFAPFYKPLGWNIYSPMDQLDFWMKELSPQTDMIVLLSHLGIRDDEWIAESYQEIDIILGAHTHHIFHEGKEINGTLLGAAGKHGHYVGHIILEFDTDQKIFSTRKAQLYEQDGLPVSKDEEKQIKGWHDEGEKMLNETAAVLERDLKADWFNPSELPQLLSDALLHWCEADCAFLNAGLVLEGLRKGKVSKFDIHRILPHPINPCVIHLTGAELKEVIKATRDEELHHLQVKGLGFRGKVMGIFAYSSITFGKDIHHIFINGEPINHRRTYKLATTDMFTFGHFFPELQRNEKQYYMPEFLRDVLAWKLKGMNSR